MEEGKGERKRERERERKRRGKWILLLLCCEKHTSADQIPARFEKMMVRGEIEEVCPRCLGEDGF